MDNQKSHLKWAAAVCFAIMAVIFLPLGAWASVKGEVVGNKVNVRTEASLQAEILFMASRGNPVTVEKIEGDYYRVNIGMERDRYISRDFIAITEIIGTVVKDGTPLLDKPLSEGGVSITRVNATFAVNVQSCDDEGYYIDYIGKDYFIEKENLSVPDIVEIPEKGEEVQIAVSGSNFRATGNTADDVVNYAKEFIGSRYRYGGSGPSGFDCSGFVSYVLKNFGVSVSRSSASMASNGVAVSRDQLQKGDLLFFATTNGSSRISHVGMYIGNGQFIHSSTWGKGVVITDLNEAYYSRCFVNARRVL